MFDLTFFFGFEFFTLIFAVGALMLKDYLLYRNCDHRIATIIGTTNTVCKLCGKDLNE